MDIKIIDKDKSAGFIRNAGEYPMHHHGRGLTLVPGTLYKLVTDDWIEKQPILVACDESGEPLPKAEPKAKAEPKSQ